MNELKQKIENKKAVIGIVGIGYVGNPLALAVNEAGFRVIGFSKGKKRAEALNSLKISSLWGTTDISYVKECEVICICVPTPVKEDKSPDLSILEEVLYKLALFLRKGQLIVVESSISPGVTRDFAIPILEESGLEAGKDFYVGYSPERIDPGNLIFNIKNTPKVVAGFDWETTVVIKNFYENFIEKVIPVSSLETAEMVKILENTFRLVNISLVNQLSEYMRMIGVDPFEVIEGASTKPFGFMAHYPGPGVGGHCIPVDPFYVYEDAKKMGINLSLIEEAGKINDSRPIRVVNKIKEILAGMNKNGSSKIFLIGVAYKSNIDDVRESPALAIWSILKREGFDVSYHDPFVPSLNGFKSLPLNYSSINDKDIIVLTTYHTDIDYSRVTKWNKPILDTRNVFKGVSNKNIYLL